jgi:hypothetical protein
MIGSLRAGRQAEMRGDREGPPRRPARGRRGGAGCSAGQLLELPQNTTIDRMLVQYLL